MILIITLTFCGCLCCNEIFKCFKKHYKKRKQRRNSSDTSS